MNTLTFAIMFFGAAVLVGQFALISVVDEIRVAKAGSDKHDLWRAKSNARAVGCCLVLIWVGTLILLMTQYELLRAN